MTITILVEFWAPDGTRTALIEITDGLETYVYGVSGIPPATSDLQGYLDGRASILWGEAQARGDDADLFGVTDILLARVLKALVLALRDRDETMVTAINALADFVGVPAGNPSRPSPLTVAQIKQAIKNRLPDVE